MPMRFLLTFLLCLAISNAIGKEKTVVRVGHFPNITHPQGVIGHHLTREHRGWFEQRLGPDVEVQWFVYNAGPTAMEAILTESIDLTYVGPNPAINAYMRSNGNEVRIICGACSGGSALIVQPDGRIKSDADFKGKKVGTPQFGNTQDVMARAWLISKGFRVTPTGGDVLVVPTPSAEQLPLFKNGTLDAVWTIEPWVSQLVLEAQGKVFLDESTLWPKTQGNYVTTHLVSSKDFLERHPELAKKWVLAHVELTEWIQTHSDEAQDLLFKELKQETHFTLPHEIISRAWKHIRATYDPLRSTLQQYAEDAYRVGFLKEKPNLSHIYDLRFLNQVLVGKGKPEIGN